MAHVFCVASQAALDLVVAGELFFLRFLEGRVRGVDAAHIGD